MYSDGVDSVLISFLGLSLSMYDEPPGLFRTLFRKHRNFGSAIAPKTGRYLGGPGTRLIGATGILPNKNLHIVINSVELHNMLYSLCKNLHEQTLSFAAADEIENPTG